MILERHHRELWPPSMTHDDVVTEAVAAIGDGIPNVFVIGDDGAVRGTLAKVIRTAGWELEEFASAEDFLSCTRCAVPCCVVINLTRPGLSGLELQKRLVDRPEMPIVFIAAHNDVRVAVQAMKAGAIEFLIKPVNDVVLIDAIGAAIERSRAALDREFDMCALRSHYASLSPREREVMVLVVSGLLNKLIGAELGISEITVKAHRGQVMRKMDAASLPHLVRMAAQLGLQPLPTKSHSSGVGINRARSQASPLSMHRPAAGVHRAAGLCS
jgi:FixJ family two-component response regulator